MAVDSISIKIPAGTYCCLLGPSGCGKTSVLRAIAGFEPVTAGEIRLNGEVVSSFLGPVSATHLWAALAVGVTYQNRRKLVTA